MAIDTRDKRASCYALGLPFGRAGFAPEGSINAADRLHLQLLYRGVPGDETPSVSSTLVGPWANVIECRSLNAVIECRSENQTLQLN